MVAAAVRIKAEDATKKHEPGNQSLPQADARAHVAPAGAAQPLVSLLVAAWNEEAHLVAFLTSFAALAYPQKELILCAGGTDRTLAIAQGWADPTVIVLEQQQGQGKLRALQRALCQAHGAIIVLTDADCILHSESFQQLIDPLLHNQARVTTGKVCPFVRQRALPFVLCQWTQMEWALAGVRPHSAYSPFLVGQHSALLRSIIEAAYAAPAPIEVGEDTYLAFYAMRIGCPIQSVPDGYVETEFPETFLAYVRQRSRWRRYELLQAYQFGKRGIMVKAFVSLGKHLLWLALPLLPLSLALMGWGRWGVLVGLLGWGALWGATFVRYYWRHQIGQQTINACTGIDRKALFALPLWQLLFANACAVIHLAICMVTPAWRYRW